MLIDQASSGNAVSGGIPGQHVMPNRSIPRPMHMVGMQRMQPQGIAGYNMASQAGMGGAINPGGIPMQRGVAQAHQQQQVLNLGKNNLAGSVVNYYFSFLMLFAACK